MAPAPFPYHQKARDSASDSATLQPPESPDQKWEGVPKDDKIPASSGHAHSRLDSIGVQNQHKIRSEVHMAVLNFSLE